MSESCVDRRRRRLRSVDSEGIGRVIEPRKSCVVGADAVKFAEGNIVALQG